MLCGIEGIVVGVVVVVVLGVVVLQAFELEPVQECEESDTDDV
jgi:hypothetical protein